MRITADPAKLIKLSALTVDEKQMFRIGNTVNRIIAYAVNRETRYSKAALLLWMARAEASSGCLVVTAVLEVNQAKLVKPGGQRTRRHSPLSLGGYKCRCRDNGLALICIPAKKTISGFAIQRIDKYRFS